ncbi:MAG: polar amino acid transport system permease protein [Marmoricola sp.]|jgi:polar amino acid transport system permease protein|nr:polar amino acid transport system permease protein [Marmoricola sp.]
MSFDTNLFWDSLFSREFANGALLAIVVALIAQAGGIVIGFLLALIRMNKVPVLSHIAWFYIWILRALPTLLVLLIVWNAFPQFIPSMKDPWFTPFIAACIGLGFQEGAYMSEILRSALSAVDEGQNTAARALGMTPIQSMRRVLIPQMIRVAIPPTSNEFINMIKYTSLASVIALQELLTRAQVQVASTFRYAEYYAAAAVYYLVIVSVLTIAQSRLEKRYLWTSRQPHVTTPVETETP